MRFPCFSLIFLSHHHQFCRMPREHFPVNKVMKCQIVYSSTRIIHTHCAVHCGNYENFPLKTFSHWRWFRGKIILIFPWKSSRGKTSTAGKMMMIFFNALLRLRIALNEIFSFCFVLSVFSVEWQMLPLNKTNRLHSYHNSFTANIE